MNAKRLCTPGLALLVGALLAATPTLSGAQQATDARWLPWLGCWEAENATEGTMLCILPSATDAGVQMVSVEQGREVSRETVSADGEQREGGRQGCTGMERARFSDDAQRIYVDATHTCEGGIRQQTTGLLALLSPTEWIDVRAVVVADNAATGVSRYRLAPSDVAAAAGFGDIAADRALAVRAARVQASARLGVEDVIDASRNASDEVVRAWIAERREPFRLDAEQLLRLADEGVAPDVIDVVVAVSYPRRFTLDEGARAEQTDVSALATTPIPASFGGVRGRFFDPFYGYAYGYDPYYRYDPYGYRYGYGYGYGSGYGYPGSFRPTYVVVDTRDPEPQGRVVNGRGYTRTPTTRAPPATAPSSSSGGSTTETSSSGEGSSGGSSSSGGTSTGRTAQPRPPGQ